MATIKQEKAIANVVGNGGNVTKAMKDAGYSHRTAHNPKKLTESEAWKKIMKKALPDKLLAKVHKEGLTATKKEQKIVGRDDSGAPEYEMVDVDDFPTRHRYLDTAYKLKGNYTPEKHEVKMPEEDMDVLKEILSSLRE